MDKSPVGSANSRGKRPSTTGPHKSGASKSPTGAVFGRGEKRRRDPLPALSFLKGTDLWSVYERLSALEKDLQQLQPRLALKPLKLANQILVVTAGSPAVAARLRQFEPSLIEGLRARGWLVGRIRFRPIAIHDMAPPPPARTKDPVSPAALEELEKLDAVGMNPELQAALAAFVRRQKGYNV